MSKVKLHRCKLQRVKTEGHPCWRVESALRDMGIEYEIVRESFLRVRRSEVERLSGQRSLPIIEFEDDTAYRAESSEIADFLISGRWIVHRRRDDFAPIVPVQCPFSDLLGAEK
jgi:hypothetical protein